jgi:hypothetical protein
MSNTRCLTRKKWRVQLLVTNKIGCVHTILDIYNPIPLSTWWGDPFWAHGNYKIAVTMWKRQKWWTRGVRSCRLPTHTVPHTPRDMSKHGAGADGLAGAGLFGEKSTVGWLLVSGLFWEKSIADWWLIRQVNRTVAAAATHRAPLTWRWTLPGRRHDRGRWHARGRPTLHGPSFF